MVVDKRVFPRATRAAGWHRLVRLVAALALACLVLLGLLAAMGAFRLSPVAAAGPLYVAPGGTDSGDCTNSAAPCATVQYAVDQAANGDEILVAAGVYTRPLAAAQVVHLAKSVTLRGGYTTTNWLVPDPVANPTVLDAQGLARVIYIAGPASPHIEGFTLQNGTTSTQGGGLYIDSGAPVIAGNIFHTNHADLGGAIYNQGGSPRLERNKIYGNSANVGGGLFSLDGSPTSHNNIYYNNRANIGGGLTNEGGSLTVANDVFYANTANIGGGLANASTLQVVNSIIASNVTTSTEALYDYDTATSATTVAYSLFWNNTGGDYNAAVTTGSGIVTGQDPLFVNATGGDFHLGPLSPAVNQGDPASLVEIDFEGEGRPFGPGYDIGADEVTQASLCYARLNGGRVYTTVQAAVTAAGANSLVQVAGQCGETVTINQSLTLRGGYSRTGWDNPVYGPTTIDGQGAGPVINATAGVNLTLENLHLTGGQAANGAGVYLGSNVSTVLRNNVIYNNQATTNGGGIFKTGAGLTTLQHNTIYGNTAGQGGGVYAAADAGLVTMRNNLVVGNNAGDGGGIYSPAAGRFSLGYNAFSGNTGGSAGGLAALSATDFDNTREPGFVDALGGDFHLDYATSQVIDAADPASDLPADFDGHRRPQGPRRDIGADESRYYIAAALSQPPGVLITETLTLPGRVFTFNHTLTNNSYIPSAGPETFILSAANSDGWGVTLDPTDTEIPLASGASYNFQVIVTAPGAVPAGIYNQTLVEVRSQTNDALLASATDLIANPGVQLAPSYTVNADPGTVLTFTHTLTNTGPVSDTFDLSLSSSMGWGRLAAPLTPTVTLERDEATQVLVVVEVPPSAPAELADLIRLTAVSTVNAGVTASITDSVTANGTIGTRYVAPAPAGTNVDNNCTQQDTPCATINHALNQAAWGDSVLVARGTYPQSGELEIKQNISLYGDYVFSGGVFARQGPVDPSRTIIDAQNSGRGLRFRGLPVTIQPVVEGFTIRNAAVTGQPGGAIYLESTSSPTLTHLILENSQAGNGAGLYIDAGRPDVIGIIIRNTTASNRGGAVYVNSGSPLLQNVAISTTRAANGGGIYLAGGSARLESSSIYSASATTAGGGLYVLAGNSSGQELWLEANRATSGGGLYQAGGSLVFSRTRASSNTATSGGAFYNSGGSLSLWNNFVYSNTATGDGGGLYQGSGSLNVINDSFYGNRAAGSGGAIYDTGSAGLVVSNTIFAANSAGSGAGGLVRNSAGSRSVDYNLFWNNPGGDTGGSGLPATFPNTIFGQDPLFVDAAAGDLHLTGDSPAVDRGDPATHLAADIDGDRRPINQGPDIGADELGGCLVRNANTGIEYGVVQQAIDEAGPNHVLQVAGICRGVQPRQVGGETVNQTALITRSLTLQGGFNPSGSWTNPNPNLYPTILDAQDQGRVVVITTTGAPLSVVLLGLTLQNGQAGGLNGAGGAVYNYGNNNLSLRSSVISNSQATLGGGLYSDGGNLTLGGLAAGQQTQFAYNNAQSGGGFYVAGGNVTIGQTAFFSNTANAGGGLYLAGGLVSAEVITAAYNSAVNGGGIYNATTQPVTLERSLVVGNAASGGSGGGLYNAAGTDLDLINTLVASNTTSGNGGGLYNLSDNLEARHNTFYANRAGGQGGGIYTAGGATPVINSNLLVENTAPAGGSGIFSPVEPVFDYNNLFNNAASFTPNGTNYSGLNPNFLSIDPTSASFLHIPGGSPVEDRGDPDSPVMEDIDLDGRPSNQSHDIGADEVGGCYARINNQPTIYGSVQRAVGNANPGDTVKIAGTCTGVLTFIDGGQPVSQTVFLTKSLTLEGGYTRDNWTAPDSVANPTYLDALERGRVLYVTGGAAVTATGLHLRQGNADNGGAVFVGGEAELRLSSNAIYSSTAVNGGGLYLESGVAMVYDDNELFANTATNGGGAYNAGGSLTLDDTHLHDNQATSGGAYYHAGGTSLLQNNVIHHNEATSGGGFYNAAGNGLTARHNTLYANTATDGGGFYNAAGNPTVVSTIFAAHTVTGAGHAIFSAVPYAPRYNDAYPVENAYNGQVNADATNLSADPRFVDAAAGDFHLQADSPVIDRGDPAMTLQTDFDDDKNPPDLRPGGQGFDIGADEIPGCRARILETGVIYGNIQAAINASLPGQTVQVTAVPACGGVHPFDPGTGVVYQTAHVPHSLALVGGYNDTFNGITGRSTLDPLNQGRAMYVANGVVLSMTNFVLQNGNAVAGGGGQGGGLYYDGSQAFLSNLHLVSNTATYGGGLFDTGSSLSMTTSSIYSNTALQGGGIYIDADSGLDMAGNSIYDNEANLGGGIYNHNSSGKLDRGNRIYDNQAASGGGLYSDAGALRVWNTFIYGNRADNGAGLYIAGGAAEVRHNTLYNNTTPAANGLGGGAYLAAAGATLHSNIFLDNVANNGGDAVFAASSASLDYNDYYPFTAATVQNVATGTHSLTLPPALADPANGDFELNFGSPMINRAEPDTLDHDFEDDPRPINGGWDIGADERNDCLAQVWRGGAPVSDIHGSITAALNEASDGDTVRVAEGVCYERITIAKNLALSGSWNKELTSQSIPGGPTEASTTIDAGKGGRVVFISAGGSVSLDWLKLTNGAVGSGGSGGAIDSQAANLTLTGMYIISNTAAGNGGGVYIAPDKQLTANNSLLTQNNSGNGAGLYLDSNSVATVSGSEISDNAATASGGGIYNAGQLTISQSPIHDNTAGQDGGGIYNAAGSQLDLTSNGIFGLYRNSASVRGGGLYNGPGSRVSLSGGADEENIAQSGGGVYNDGASFEIFNKWLNSNQATGGHGGGVYVTGASAITFTNLLLYDNQASGSGGGLYRNASGSASLYHTTIHANTANEGGGVFNAGSGIVISASIVAYNISASGSNGIQSSPSANVAYTLSAPGTTSSGVIAGAGNINDAHPNFYTLSGSRLSYISPAIDKVPTAESHVPVDSASDPRPQLCSKDMGLDEYRVGVRTLTWETPTPDAATVIPTDSFTYTYPLRNDSELWTGINESAGVGTGYTETLTVTVNSSRNWARIVDVTNVGDLVIQPDGQSATFAVGPAAYVGPANVVVVVDVPSGAYGGLVDETRLAYEAFQCAGYTDPAPPSGLTPPVETTVAAAHLFSISPNNSGFALPGQTVTYTHILTNDGNITDTYILYPSLGFYAGAIQSWQPVTITLPPLRTTPVTVSYTIKPDAAAGLTDTTSVIVQLNVGDEPILKGAANNTYIGYTTGTRHVALSGNDSAVTESDDGPVINDNNCTDPVLTGPCRTIQHAIDQASPGDTIKIAGGQYTDLVAVLSGGQVVTQTAFINKSLTLQGGYDETDVDSWFIEPPAHLTFTTSLNPQNQGRALFIVATGAVTVDRLVLTNGDAGGGSGPTGGGLIYNQQAGLVLHANRLGGGSAAAGGGLYSAGGDLLLQNNMLHDNTAASGDGGAVHAANGAVRLENNTFFRNDAGGDGGALFVDNVSLVVSNTLFASNEASAGGAIGAGTIDSSSVLTYNLYFDNSPGNVSGLPDAGLVTSGDPLFIDAAADPPNLHIQGGSPAQNTGDPGTRLAIDYDNDPRPQPLNSTLFDIGADEDVLEPDLEFEPDVITTTLAGSTIIITHYLTNTGEFTDTYTITFSSSHPGWIIPPLPDPYTVELAQGEMTPVVVTYVVPSGADGLTSVTVLTATSAAGVWDTVSDTIKVQAPAWAIAKTAEPDPVSPGGTLTYTITITNIGDLDSSGTYTVTDTLPEFTEFVSAANPEATLIGREVRWVQSSPVLSNGGAVSFSLVLTVTRPLTDGTLIVNDTYGVTGGGAVEAAAGDPITVTVSAPAGLSISKTAQPSPVQPGDFLTYTLTITNDAAGPALGVVISDTLSPDVVYQSMGFDGGTTGIFTATPPLLQWELSEPLGADATAQVTATVRVLSPLAAPALLTNTFSVTATNLPAVVSDTITTPLEATNIMTLSKSVFPDEVTPGATVTYTIHLTNTGNGIASVSLADTLAAGFTPPAAVLTATVPGRDWAGTSAPVTVSFTATVPGATGVYFNRAVTATYNITGEATIEQTAPVTVSAPIVTFSSPDYTVNEDAGPAMITVTLSAASSLTATVEYATADGPVRPALAGSDYTAQTGVITFAPGTTLQTFSVPITDDTVFEGDETVALSLSNPGNATLGSPVAAMLTIVDPEDAPLVRFETAAYSVAEEAGPAVITVTLSSPSSFTATVLYATANGSAETGSDYTGQTGVITFAPGTTLQTFSVPITDDLVFETNETVQLSLSSPVSATLGAPAAATLTIVDNDSQPEVSFEALDYSVGEAGGSAVITVTLSAASGFTVTVNYATTPGTATEGLTNDYLEAIGVLTFNPGVTRQTFEVPVIDDAIYEGDETVLLSLSDPVSATLVAPAAATLTIIDDETPPEFSFSAANYSIDENDPGGTATITVTLSLDSEVTSTVRYATGGGSATPGSDYTAASGVLTFAPGSLLQTFTVSIINDPIFEGDETVLISLSDPNGGELGTPASAILTIVDDETEPEISFSLAAYSVAENAGPAVITVTLAAPAVQTSTVDYATADGSATATDDYTAQSGVLTFTPGISQVTFSVPITDDTDLEGYETVELSLSNPQTATLSTTAFTATLTIVDDDVPVVDFSSATYTVNEADNTATITVTLSMTSTEEGRVSFRTENITALSGSDYTGISGELAFPPDSLTQTFTVDITEDSLYELDETVRLVLFDPVLLTLGAANTPAVLTIVDNDPDARPKIGFNPADYSVAEAAGPAVITVTLSGPSGVTTTVEYEVQDQTAQAGPDYLAASGVLTFNPGETSQTFSVTINDDGLHEIDETAGLALANADYADIVTGTGTLTIIDDDLAPEVGFSQIDYSVAEAAGPAVITVTLSAESGLTATVAYSTSHGTAGDGDYTAQTGVLTFTPGITQVTFTVPITDDGLFEADETVQLSLANASAASITTGAATLTIVDDDAGALPEVDFSSATYTVNEAEGSAVITVTLSAESGLEATVAYTSSHGTAGDNDYTAVSDVLTFAPGITQVTFSVPITNDTDLEGTETVILTLALANNAVFPASGGNNPATLVIVDDDTPLVRFSSAAYSVDEPDGPAVITVTLSMAPSVTATVVYTSAGQTATAGPDYLAASGVLTFSPGEMTGTFSVTINDDAIYEGPETLQLALSSPNNAELGSPETAILTIVDDETEPLISFSSATYSVAEDAGSAVITVTLSAVSGLTATVSYATADDTATAPDDYIAVTNVLTFTPGLTRVTFIVPIANDSLSEGDEQLRLLLSGESGAGLGSPDTASLTILDDDAPQVGFSSAAYSVNEGAGTATITVTLTSALLVESRVSFVTEDITATAGDDYTTTGGELIFPAGSLTQTFDVTILEDLLDEPAETLRLRLLSPVGLTIPAPTAELTIVDNDEPPAIGFDPTEYVVDEAAGTATITVTLSAVSGLTATVEYATSNGSAVAGQDYTATSGQLSIYPGDITATFTVPITDDSLYEADETVWPTLNNAVNARLTFTDTAVLTITDNDLAFRPTVSFSSDAYSATEGDPSGASTTITVTLSAASGVTATVVFSTSDGTATEGLTNDYLGTTGVLTFAPGVLTRTFFVLIMNDSLIEDDETVELALLDPGETDLADPSTATLTIIDDDVPVVEFSSPTYSVNEAAATVTITVTLSQAFNKPVSVSYATANGSAVAGQDYTSTTNVLTLGIGETSQTFDVTIIDDGLYELDETVGLTLYNPVSAEVGLTNPATLTIVSDDPPPQVSFSSADYTVDEGAGTAVITVTLSEVSGVTATVVYTAENGTALAGSDYQATSGTLLFPPGSLARTFNVTVIDDAIQETPETVTLRLGNPVDATIGATNPATLTITDNDVPAASFSSATYSVSEGDGTAIITVTLSVVPLAEVSVTYSSSDGTAVAGSDYTPVSGVLTFTAGMTQQTFAVPILVDDVGEPAETVQLALSDPINGLLGAIPLAELTIIDDDLFGVYLPLVLQAAAGPLPDLRPVDLIVEPATGLEATTPVVLKVVVQNVGQGPAPANFWVDFYINPSTFPATAGYPWATLCGASPCYGLAWQVRQPLAPGESITLSSEPGSLYLDPSQTRWDGAFNRSGTQRLGVYVDSWNGFNKPAGFVLETDETNNLIRRDVDVSGAGAQAGSQGGGDAGPVPARPLPEK